MNYRLIAESNNSIKLTQLLTVTVIILQPIIYLQRYHLIFIKVFEGLYVL